MKDIIIKVTKKEMKTLILILILIGLGTIVELFLPIILQRYIDEIFDGSSRIYNLYMLAIYYFSGGIILFLTKTLKIIKVEKASWKLCDNLRLEVIGRIIQYNQEFYNNFTTGEIVEGIDSDIDKIETYIKEALLPIAVNVLNILGIIIVLLNKNRILGVVILVFVCISFALLIREVRKDDHVIIEERISTNQLNGMFGEIIENRIEINVFGRIRGF